ncbi:MAG: DUF4136 domain-containing protein [Bacteroidota bacterium]
MKKINGLLTALAVLFILAGCGPRTYVSKDESYDISKVRNYTWVRAQRDSLGSQRSGRANDLVKNTIKTSFDRNFAATGWRQVRPAVADVYVVYDMNVQRENVNVSDPVYSTPMTRWYYSPYRRGYVPIYYPSTLLGYNNSVQTVNEGTITLTIIDAKTDKTIWQGSATSEINGRRMSDAEIDDHVKAIIKKLV